MVCLAPVVQAHGPGARTNIRLPLFVLKDIYEATIPLIEISVETNLSQKLSGCIDIPVRSRLYRY